MLNMHNDSFYYKTAPQVSGPWSRELQQKGKLRHTSMSVTRLENLLNSAPDAGLDSLVQQARRMGELTRVLRTALDPDLASSLKSANLRDGGVLVLICESSNWAARLRFEAESLMDVARANGATVNTCRVMVSRSN